MVCAKGFATEIEMLEGVDVSGVNALPWSEDVELVRFEWWRAKEQCQEGYSRGNRRRRPMIVLPTDGFLVASQDEEG